MNVFGIGTKNKFSDDISRNTSSIDWLKMFKDSSFLKDVIFEHLERFGKKGPFFLPEYRPELNKSEFLVPSYIIWRKDVDTDDLLQSSSITDKRKKYIRQAIKKSEKLGVSYKIVNPVERGDFERFYKFYMEFCREHNYSPFLKESFIEKRDLNNVWLIEVWNGSEYLGARLVSRYGKVLSTDYRAIARTSEIKEGYDIVCEKLYFDLASKLGINTLGRGKELNLRGVENKSIGMIWNKLKYGYKPIPSRSFPIFYSDYSFLKNISSDLMFFLSMKNDRRLWEINYDKNIDFTVVQAPELQLNFVLGKNKISDNLAAVSDKETPMDINLLYGQHISEIKSVMKKSPYPLEVWDLDFNNLSKFISCGALLRH